MPVIKKQALVPHSAQTMYNLVNDVESYAQFLPGCVNAVILEASEQRMLARLDVAKAGIRQSFTTENILTPHQHIEMRLHDGPFKHLKGGWQFNAWDEQACKVKLELEFEFSNRLVAMAFGKVFESLVNAMIQAFTKRAKEVGNE